MCIWSVIAFMLFVLLGAGMNYAAVWAQENSRAEVYHKHTDACYRDDRCGGSCEEID